MSNALTKKNVMASAATDSEWAEFQEFLGGDEDQAEAGGGGTSPPQQATNDIDNSEKKGISEEQRVKNDHDEEMTQAAYGARLASLLLKRQELFGRKKGSNNNPSNSSDARDSTADDRVKDMYEAPSLAFDEDNFTSNKQVSVENDVGKSYLNRKKRQKVQDDTAAFNELDWRFGE